MIHSQCMICGGMLGGTKYTILLTDYQKLRCHITGHEECTSEIMTKVKSYKDYEKLPVTTILKRLKLDDVVEVEKL